VSDRNYPTLSEDTCTQVIEILRDKLDFPADAYEVWNPGHGSTNSIAILEYNDSPRLHVASFVGTDWAGELPAPNFDPGRLAVFCNIEHNGKTDVQDYLHDNAPMADASPEEIATWIVRVFETWRSAEG
jgi:hypothetical protein